MKNLLLQYKPFLLFLLKFFVLYAVLTVGYSLYLNRYADNVPDGFTRSVARQAENLLVLFGHQASTAYHVSEPSMNLWYEGKCVARIVEGCNAVSVMILFSAFVFAFSARWSRTVAYIILGCVIIHVLNVLRIALLAMALYAYPQYEHLLHGVVFPLFIYSVVFILWVLWVQKFSGHAEKNPKQ